MDEKKIRKQIRGWILFLMGSIFIIGITTFPLEAELKWLSSHAGIFPDSMAAWIRLVYSGLHDTDETYPFLFYGTDWLAFAHLIIAMLYIGPLMDPVKNSWVIDWSILCCFLSFITAFIAGPIRYIPFFHQLIDCGFGAIGLFPLFFIRKKIKQLREMEKQR